MRRIYLYLTLLSIFAACAKSEEEPQPAPVPEPVPGPVAVTSVTILPETGEIVEGDTLHLKVTVLPENATDKSYTIVSNKDSVASVDSCGVVTGISKGSAVITVTASGGKTANSLVRVIQDPTVYAISIRLNEEQLVLKRGESHTVSCKLNPSSVTETAGWASSDESVATVDSNGRVTAVSGGSAVITAFCRDCSDSLAVSVVDGEFLLSRVDALTRVVNNCQYADNPDPVLVARGETAALQFCVTSYADISAISADVKVNGELSSLSPKLYWEREITCSRHWDSWAGGPALDEVYTDGDKYFDPLMPLDVWNPAPLTSGSHAVLWCEFDIPRSFSPGTYDATVSVTVTSGGVETVLDRDFVIEVSSVALPEKQGLTIINWECGDFKAMNGGRNMEYHTSWEPLMTVLVEFMNDYGQNAWRTIYATHGNMDDRCKADYSTEPYTVKYNFDGLWSREFELYVNKCRDIHQVHGQQFASSNDDNTDLCLQAFTLDYDDLDEDNHPTLKFKSCFATEDDDNARNVKSWLAEYFRQLGDYLRSHEVGDGRTWLDLYAQTIIDEPRDAIADAYNAAARVVKTGCPEMKITDAIETDRIDPELLDYPCPTLKFIDECRATGTQTQWMYTCMNPQGNYANRFIRIPTIKTRIVHWCNYYYDAPAYLHWGLKYWQGAKDEDPYGDVYGQFIGGDSFIIYPDYRKVYPSIRLCAMRDGIRDYDLLKMVEARNRSKAREFLGNVVEGTAKYNTDVKDFRQTRRQIIEFLSE